MFAFTFENKAFKILICLGILYLFYEEKTRNPAPLTLTTPLSQQHPPLCRHRFLYLNQHLSLFLYLKQHLSLFLYLNQHLSLLLYPHRYPHLNLLLNVRFLNAAIPLFVSKLKFMPLVLHLRHQRLLTIHALRRVRV